MAIALAGATLGAAPAVGADARCRVLRLALQPDCFRSADAVACDPKRLDLGPQIAVWLEAADGSRLETILVTNLTAARGVGNRPGRWDFRSNPRWPYGRRHNVLPVWAHRRGHLYPQIVMQDGLEDTVGFHENVSSPDPYYCRPLRPDEVVDAVSCPTALFNSAKGRIDDALPRLYYPPRNDLSTFISKDCDAYGMPCPPGGISAERYAEMNDLDAVAAATPPYGRVFERAWPVPASIPDGAYLLEVEVNKEFDGNAAHNHPSFEDPMLRGYGAADNFGQPSVVYSLALHLADGPVEMSTIDIAGYADWDGATGDLHPPDEGISDAPGSGRGRLALLPAPYPSARVFARVEDCGKSCVPPPPVPSLVDALEAPVAVLEATAATLRFRHAADEGGVVTAYEVRYRVGSTMTGTEFAGATAGPDVSPGEPGRPAEVTLDGLRPDTTYVAGVRAVGRCRGEGPLVTVAFHTLPMKYRQLSGCFVATALAGSADAAAVVPLRELRDRFRRASALGRAAVDQYERASPPAAAVLARSVAGRAALRPLLAVGARLATVVTAAAAVAMTPAGGRVPTPFRPVPALTAGGGSL